MEKKCIVDLRQYTLISGESMPTDQSIRSASALRKIRAVSFDLDDTFWDCEPTIVKAEETLYLWLEQHHPGIVESRGRNELKALRADMYRTHPHLASDVSIMRKTFLQLLFNKHDNSEQLADQAFEIFYRARSQVVLYDGTHEILSSLQKTHKVAAITNGNADLALIGLADYFHDIQKASLDSPPKPAVGMFDVCCQNLGIAANELIHVGDNPQTDVVGAHNAGALAVWYNQLGAIWPEELPRADFEVKSLPELKQLLTS